MSRAGLACALAFTALSITIPILIKKVIDEAIVGPHHGRLLPYLGIIVALATLRFGVNFARRFATARVGSPSRRDCAGCSTTRT